MKDLLELQQERMHKLRTAEDIHNKAKSEDRILSDDEGRMVDDCLKEAKLLQDEIDAREADEQKRQRVVTEIEAARKPANRTVIREQPNPEPIGGRNRIEIPGYVARYGQLKAFKGPNAERDAYVSGQWVQAAIFNNYRAKEWCNKNGINYRNDLNEGTNTLGGNLVPEEFSQAIIDLRETYGVFRRVVGVVPMGRDTLNVPRRLGGNTAYFVGEGSAITSSDPTWNQVQLTAKKLAVLTKMSTELAEDAVINLADWLAQEFAYAFANKEDLCGFTGDGTSTYGGITGVAVRIIDGTHGAGAQDATAGHDTLAEIDATDLSLVMSKVPQYARAGSRWYCSQTAYDLVFSRLASAAGGNTVQTLTGAYAPSYLGYPIEVTQTLTASTGNLNNAVMLLFGNMAQACTMGERRGISVATTMDRYFENDQIGLKATERIDITVHDLGDGTTAGPVAALVGQT